MRLALLPGGSVYLDKGRVITPGVDVGVRIHVPVWSALIETDEGQRILIDTGMHQDHISHPDATYEGTPSAGLMPAVMTFNDLLPNRLQQMGVSTNSIDTVILSHLHWDHCGQTHLFPRATVLCPARLPRNMVERSQPACRKARLSRCSRYLPQLTGRGNRHLRAGRDDHPYTGARGRPCLGTGDAARDRRGAAAGRCLADARVHRRHEHRRRAGPGGMESESRPPPPPRGRARRAHVPLARSRSMAPPPPRPALVGVKSNE